MRKPKPQLDPIKFYVTCSKDRVLTVKAGHLLSTAINNQLIKQEAFIEHHKSQDPQVLPTYEESPHSKPAESPHFLPLTERSIYGAGSTLFDIQANIIVKSKQNKYKQLSGTMSKKIGLLVLNKNHQSSMHIKEHSRNHPQALNRRRAIVEHFTEKLDEIDKNIKRTLDKEEVRTNKLQKELNVPSKEICRDVKRVVPVLQRFAHINTKAYQKLLSINGLDRPAIIGDSKNSSSYHSIINSIRSRRNQRNLNFIQAVSTDFPAQTLHKSTPRIKSLNKP